MAKATGSGKGSNKAVKTTDTEKVVKTTTDKGVAGVTVTETAKEEQPATAVAEQVKVEGEQPELVDHVVNSADLVSNPDLNELGVKEGDVIKIEVVPEKQLPEELKANAAASDQLAAKPNEIVTTSADGETKTSVLPIDKKEEEELADAAVEIHGKMEKYRKAYPNEKRFYITSDEQVFLSGNKIEALEHQRGLDKSVAVTVFDC
jgi:hypothetical protein